VVFEHLADHDFALHAPHLVDVEVLSALGGSSPPARRRSSARAKRSPTCATCRIERYPHAW
jgi:hypothetical protein